MSIKQKAIKGAAWGTASTATSAIISVLRLSILTRFLEKADFGLVAIVTLILGFTNIFADLGVSISLFSKEHISKKEYSSLYWVTILQGVLLYLILIAISPLIVQFYDLPILYNLIPIMGLDLICSNAGRQFKVFLQKQLRFKKIAIIEITTLLISLVASIILAQKGYGVYSLVYSTVTASFLNALLLIVSSYKTHPILLYMNIKENKQFYKIGIYQTGAQILDYLSNNFDIILIGKLMNPAQLGVYNLLKLLVLRVYRFINPIVSNISIPVLAKFRENISLLKSKYLDGLNIISAVNIATFGLLASVAREAVYIIYGADYTEYYPILMILCLWGAITTFTGAASSVVAVFGKTDLGFKWTIFRVIVNPVFLYLGFNIGSFYGLVIGQVCFSVMSYFIYFNFIIKKILQIINFKEYIFVSCRYFLAASVAVVFTVFLRGEVLHYKIQPILLSIGFAIIFFVIYLAGNRKKMLDLYLFLKQR